MILELLFEVIGVDAYQVGTVNYKIISYPYIAFYALLRHSSGVRPPNFGA